MLTRALGKPLRYLFFKLQHCHALHLLFCVAQVDDHLLPPESMYHHLVDFAHLCAVCSFVSLFVYASCCAPFGSVAELKCHSRVLFRLSEARITFIFILKHTERHRK